VETGLWLYSVFLMFADTCEWFSYRCQLYPSVFSVLVSSYNHRPGWKNIFTKYMLSVGLCLMLSLGLFVRVFVCEMFFTVRNSQVPNNPLSYCNRSLCVCLVAVSLSQQSYHQHSSSSRKWGQIHQWMVWERLGQFGHACTFSFN